MQRILAANFAKIAIRPKLVEVLCNFAPHSLDRIPASWKTSKELTRSRPPLAQRTLSVWLRIISAGALTVFILWGAVDGLWKQRSTIPSGSIDCAYRATLFRDRLVSILERPVQTISEPASSKELQFFTLLRETREVCARSNPELKSKFERMSAISEDFLLQRQRVRQARDELRAMF